MGAAVRNQSSPSLARIVIGGCRRGHGQAFHGLTGDLGDEVEVLIEVQYGQPGEFSGRRDDQIRTRPWSKAGADQQDRGCGQQGRQGAVEDAPGAR